MNYFCKILIHSKNQVIETRQTLCYNYKVRLQKIIIFQKINNCTIHNKIYNKIINKIINKIFSIILKLGGGLIFGMINSGIKIQVKYFLNNKNIKQEIKINLL